MAALARAPAGRGPGRWPIFSLSLAALIAGAALAPGAADAGTALPSGGHVTAGAATIATSGSTETIDQTSAKAVIDWASFSIGKGGAVSFDNGAGATLNEVGGGSRAEVDGLLSGTGSVYVIDPAGVIIGKSGVVQVGGTFVASTLDPDPSQFLVGGALTFSGASRAAVVNLGKIGSLGGDVALIGASVANSGQITAANGDVGLAAGSEVVVQDRLLDNGKFSVVLGGSGASVTNTGLIRAAEAELRANGGNVYALAGNAGGTIEATGVAGNDGKVFLVAEGGETVAQGLITAQTAVGAGGDVETSGDTVDFTGLKVVAANWLIDPVNLTVDAAAAATISSNLATTSVTLRTTATGASGPGTQSPGAGDIDIDAPISWSSANTLTLDAFHGIGILAPITVTGSGHLVLTTDDGGTGGALDFGLGSEGFAGNIQFTGPEPPGQSGFHNPHDMLLTINGAGYVLIYSLSELEDVNKKQLLSGDYALAHSIDATGFTGYVPVGGNKQADFTGVFEGLGNTISNLTIVDTTPVAQTTADDFSTNGAVGLFGTVGTGGVLRDVTLTNVNVSGAGSMVVGALAGLVSGGSVANVSSSGEVATGSSGAGYEPVAVAGGLIGAVGLGGTVDDASSSASVTAGNSAAAGGLVGSVDSGASLTDVHASGNVSVGANLSATYSLAGGLVGGLYGFTRPGGVGSDPASITDAYATGNVSGGGGSDIGGFIGEMQGGQVSDAYATGSVAQTAENPGGVSNIAGGFVGSIDASASVIQSYSAGTVSTVGGPSGSSFAFAGGFTGGLNPGGSASNDYSLSPVSATVGGGFTFLGGFAGFNNASISDVYAAGAVSGPALTAGLVGFLNSGAALTNSYWDEGTTGQTVDVAVSAGGVDSGNTGIGGSTGLSPYAASTYANFDLSASGPWVIFDGSTRPMLRMEYATTITNGHQLQLMALNPAANYTLANDIDLSATSTNTGVWNPATGFVPVGGNGAAAFAGAFEGDGHTLSNLFIDDTTAVPITLTPTYATSGEVGLFGAAGPGSVIRDVTLANANVTGAGAMLVGALVGIDFGAITNVSTSGVVTSGAAEGNSDLSIVGGVAGDIRQGTIADSSSSASVIGGNASLAGGLAGVLSDGGAITSSSATGDVTIGPGSFGQAGGLVGTLFGFVDADTGPINAVSVSNAYATGNVTGGAGDAIGGFVGVIDEGQVSGSHSTGSVSQTGATPGLNNFAGGFAGIIAPGQVTGSYATGAVTQTGAAAGADDFAGGFAADIVSGSQITGSYATGSVTQPLGGSGSDDFIGGFGGYVSGSAISQSDSAGAVSAQGGLDASSPTFAGGLVGFVDAGGSVAGSYSNSSVTVAGAGPSYAGGLVGFFNGVSVAQSYATGPISGDDNVGGLVGFAGAGTITGASASGVVSGVNQVGGLIGQLAGGQVTQSSASGNVNGQTSVGGFVGLMTGGAVTASSASGGASATGNTGSSDLGVFVSGTDSTPPNASYGVGGFVGLLQGGAITQSSAVGNVTGGQASLAGGFAGASEGGSTLSFDFATGSVIQTTASEPTFVQAAGGFIGFSNSGFITRSYATGAVSDVSGGSAGGFAGQLNGATITDSYATGAVSEAQPSQNNCCGNDGGFVGSIGFGGSVSQSWASGDVTSVGGGSSAGGFVGSIGDAASSITDSYATGSVTNFALGPDTRPSILGGFAGSIGGTIENVYSIGQVTGGDVAGGLVGVNIGGAVTNGYWDTQTSSQSVGIGVNVGSGSATGLTTMQLQSGLPAGFSPSIWKITPGVTFPLLQWQGP